MPQNVDKPLPGHALWCDDDDLVAAFQRGSNGVLAVCFLSFTPEADIARVRQRRVRQSSIVGAGVNNVLYLTDLSWTWYAQPEIRRRSVKLIQRAQRECRAVKTVAFGNSAGGSGAILLNAEIGFDAVLATSPQLDLRLAFRAFDRRWSSWLAPNVRDFEFPGFHAGLEAGGEIVLMHGLRGPDAAHAAMAPQAAHIHHFLFPDMGHDLSRRLRPGGLMGKIFSGLTAGNLPRAEELIVKAGGLRRGNLGYQAGGYDWEAAGPANLASQPAGETRARAAAGTAPVGGAG